MSIIIVSDIFGVTPALLDMAEKVGATNVVDPYEGRSMAFQNEADAYSYFVETVGLDKYLAALLKVVESVDHQVTLIGFSVGASVVWRLSELKGSSTVKHAICYYGSQIRNFTEIEPKFKINLVFPASEPAFDVVALQKVIASKVNVKTDKVTYLHGFMNYHSSNYNEIGYKEQMDFLCSVTSLPIS